MNYKKLSIPERLGTIKDAIMVVQSDLELAEAFADVGYSPERLSEGLDLEEAARAYWMTQQVEYGTRLEATGAFRAQSRAVTRAFRKDRALAKLTLQNLPGLYEKLRLNENVERRRDRLSLQMQHFYTEALNQPDVLALLAEVNLTQEVLQARLDAVTSLNVTIQNQLRQTGQAIATTSQRRAAMDELDTWASQFFAIARAIFKENPGQMEKLGALLK